MNIFTRAMALALIVTVMLGTTSCQTASDHPTAAGAIVGGLVGAAAGAALDSNNRGRGALIGAAAGAVVGGGIGYFIGKQREKFDTIEGVETQERTVAVPADGSAPTATPDAGEPAPPTVQREALTLTMRNELLFEKDSSALTPAGGDKLTEIADILREYPESDVIIKGYSSSEGDDAHNMDLSQRRADMVKNQLIASRVRGDRLIALGMGESGAVASNSTELGRTRNRRVEIDVVPRDEIK